MAKTVQIRDVSDKTYEELRRRAAARHLSLTQYLRGELDRIATTRTMAEILAEADAWRERTGGVSRQAMDDAIEDMRTARRE